MLIKYDINAMGLSALRLSCQESDAVHQDPSGLGTPSLLSVELDLEAMSTTAGRQFAVIGGECGHRDRRSP